MPTTCFPMQQEEKNMTRYIHPERPVNDHRTPSHRRVSFHNSVVCSVEQAQVRVQTSNLMPKACSLMYSRRYMCLPLNLTDVETNDQLMIASSS